MAANEKQDKAKKESLERLVQQYLQAVQDNDTKKLKMLKSILKRLGYDKVK